VYVLINPTLSRGPCAGYQTFDIAKPSGALTFQGVAVASTDFEQLYPITITGNDKFAYALSPNPPEDIYRAFFRESDGTLANLNNFNEIDPENAPPPYEYFPWVLTADPTNHLAVALGTVKFLGSPIVTVGPV
jgi:hypothetical protein